MARDGLVPYIRGEHIYDVVEGQSDSPTSVKVRRLDKAQLDDEEVDEIEEKLSSVLPREIYQVDLATDSSGEELLFSVRLTPAEAIRRKATSPDATVVVPMGEILAVISRIPTVLY